MSYHPNTVKAFSKLYAERKDTIDYLEKFGNRFEKAQALLIKEIAAIRNDENTRDVYQTSAGTLVTHQISSIKIDD